MTIIHVDARATNDPGTNDTGTGDRGTGGQFGFVRLRALPWLSVLARTPPKQPVVLDEVNIAPSKQWQKQDVKRQAKQVIERAKQGKSVSEAQLDVLQKRLLSLERQDELRGRESEGRQLASELGELRRTKLVADTENVLARAKEGRNVSDADLARLQRGLQTMQRQDELAGRESQGQQLVSELADVRRSKLVGEALDVVARAKEGRRYSDRYVKNLQVRLLSVERQEELFGRESEGKQLAFELADVRRSVLVKEATDALARAKGGRGYPPGYVVGLQQRLMGMERQDELLGRESEGKQLASALGEVRRSNLVGEALDVLAKAKQGEHFDKKYVLQLQRLLLGMQRQDELSGTASQGMQLAADLAKLRR
jgi:hypothetical protein